MTEYKDRISASPEVLHGKPLIKGTRISVELILKRLSEGSSVEDLLVAYPHIAREDVLAALAYSAEVVSHEELIST